MSESESKLETKRKRMKEKWKKKKLKKKGEQEWELRKAKCTKGNVAQAGEKVFIAKKKRDSHKTTVVAKKNAELIFFRVNSFTRFKQITLTKNSVFLNH